MPFRLSLADHRRKGKQTWKHQVGGERRACRSITAFPIPTFSTVFQMPSMLSNFDNADTLSRMACAICAVGAQSSYSFE